ncbi:MAG: pyridoxal phosphate-dependent aminotransferase family protein [Desulfobacterales bacterium]|nr:pyridoxal phosphate-dependent aminotransferase family protein [Desulfobacterales bacterium]
MFTKRINDRLLIQQQAGLYRHPPQIGQRTGKYLYIKEKQVLNFASNDYLGLGDSSELRELVAENFKVYGPSSSSSRLVCGNYDIITKAEKVYADYFGYETALFFPSGYQANVALISTLFEKGDTIIFDKHIHAGSIKGIQLSGADFLGYNHNEMSHLEKRLKRVNEDQAAVITESLFSMDGDFPDIEGIKTLKEKYGFLCIVDEAHSVGVLPDLKGNGISKDVADIAVGTFGKALGLFGAFVLAPKKVREYMINFASPLIYTTSLPPAHAASAIGILNIIEKSTDKRQHLTDLSLKMRNMLKQNGFKVSGDAHIIAVEIGDEKKAVAVSRKLFEKNIFAFPARYPTVPLNKAIIRISMTALHSENDTERFVRSLKEATDEN